MKERVFFIEEIARKIYDSIFKEKVVTKTADKRKFFDLYSCLKISIDSTNETLMKILKK